MEHLEFKMDGPPFFLRHFACLRRITWSEWAREVSQWIHSTCLTGGSEEKMQECTREGLGLHLKRSGK
jgi:hypothetical protein